MVLTAQTLIRTLAIAALGTLLVSQAARAGTPESSAKATTLCMQGCGSAELAQNCYYIDEPQAGRAGKLVIRRVQECD
ncbi:hypothetical protein ACRBEV_32560 [Methylobacterium phyllosphaerae]